MAKETKPAICCVCGKDLKSRVPVDAKMVRCFACTEANPRAALQPTREKTDADH